MAKIYEITHRRTKVKVQVVDDPTGKIVQTKHGEIWIPKGELHVVEGVNDEEYHLDVKTYQTNYEKHDELDKRLNINRD